MNKTFCFSSIIDVLTKRCTGILLRCASQNQVSSPVRQGYENEPQTKKALFTVRNEAADKLHPSPFLKAQMPKLPKALWPGLGAG